ncbi:FAD-dependent oxidoreductase [Flavobacterium akiainvivens]|uniref:FAD-dependent oxidoreductase n=1 Tax=Flavobacterium akiainvivens TaxID=1202724 RepID=A0A0M8MII8_9FLAO|nr:FAD-binding oxidoreductase [Flavobacterium akiainvivens]KOS06268.1 FAD-dependent oxidoreductase [Flavobacterium akiainvivens]SFQ17523.1 Glycine/D-amino acid oxidase [Flavobacterium akiainvivens]
MTLKAGYPFWLIKNGLPFTFPKLDQDIETEVAILGAGISGALVRYHLIQAGIECVTVDARTIGLGSTSASTSLLQYEIDVPLYKLTEMIGRKDAERAYQLCGEAIEKLEQITKKVGIEYFETKKSLYYAAYKKDVAWLKDEFEARKQAGFKVKWLEPEEVKEQYGFESHGAILSQLAAQTNAYMLAHCLLQHKHKEHKIFDRSPVVDIKHHKNGVTLTTETGYTIKAKKLVYAVGYEVVDFIKDDIVDLLSTYAVVSEQYNERNFWKDDVLIWNTADPYLYLRTTPDNRVLVGGRDEEFHDPAKRDKLINHKTKQLANDVNKLFPHLEFKPEFSWTGTFGSTKDGLPYIGEHPKLPNGYFALGFGGNGITFSLIAAEIITDLITEKDNKDVQLFKFGR